MIPADCWHDNGDGTAWWVLMPIDKLQLAAEQADADRPCDTCDGTTKVLLPKPPEKLLAEMADCDCLNGRHTFDMEVARPETPDEFEDRVLHMASCDVEDGCAACFAHDTHRVSIVPGMVLPLQADPSPGSRKIGFDGEHWWWYDTTTEPWHHERVTLPSAAAPGMWAVKVKVAA